MAGFLRAVAAIHFFFTHPLDQNLKSAMINKKPQKKGFS
jgi:hypothetical protein